MQLFRHGYHYFILLAVQYLVILLGISLTLVFNVVVFRAADNNIMDFTDTLPGIAVGLRQNQIIRMVTIL